VKGFKRRTDRLRLTQYGDRLRHDEPGLSRPRRGYLSGSESVS
jgi:hypothetical protein